MADHFAVTGLAVDVFSHFSEDGHDVMREVDDHAASDHLEVQCSMT